MFFNFCLYTAVSSLHDLLQAYSFFCVGNMRGASGILVCLLALLAPLRVAGQSRCTPLGVSAEFVAPSDSGHMLVTNVSSVASKTAFCHVKCLKIVFFRRNGTAVSTPRELHSMFIHYKYVPLTLLVHCKWRNGKNSEFGGELEAEILDNSCIHLLSFVRWWSCVCVIHLEVFIFNVG